MNKRLSASFLGLSLFGFLTLNVASQTSTQSVADDGPTNVTFHLDFMVRNAPVKITHVMLGDKEVPLDTPVPVSGMWVHNINVVVQNISPKVIVQGGVILTYPETGDGSSSKPTLSTVLSLGRYPPHAFIQRDGTDKAITGRPLPPEMKVLPASSMTFKIGDTYRDIDQIKAQEIIGHPLTKLNIMFPASYYFEEGSIWRGSTYYIPAPPPVVWREITDTEFFGGTPPGIDLSPVQVASGAMAVWLIKRVLPIYPSDAKSGQVVLRVTISKQGDVTKVTPVAGSPPLYTAAIDAVKQWKYKPYVVNDQPREVDTIIFLGADFTGSAAD